ncbi:MAG TPA: tartrate-resistant acid phosphatase type 5 family protein [Ohtaekwangia sp.]|uniref:purple acid phosphatase family protein n=1 Tax=Ohtaekwangia sp. TaxID=2066019 RepID=UPI002F933CB1
MKHRLQHYTPLLCLLFITFLCNYTCAQRVEKHLVGKKVDGLLKEEGALPFIVFGDWGRNGQGCQQDVADWMGIAANQVTARFVISTGDNFYCCGVASIDDYQWISSFENIYRSHSLQIPWYNTLGNHDYQGNVQAQIDYTKKSQRWKMPDRYYTLATHDIRFVFIDTNPFVRDYYGDNLNENIIKQDTLRQLHWIDSVLASSTEKWKIVVGHHPAYSVGDHGSEKSFETNLVPLMAKHHVQVYFAGHDHSLQSLQSKKSSVHHLVSGGGSEYTSVREKDPLVKFARSTCGFMMVSVKGKTMLITFIDATGKILYKESIDRDEK